MSFFKLKCGFHANIACFDFVKVVLELPLLKMQNLIMLVQQSSSDSKPLKGDRPCGAFLARSRFGVQNDLNVESFMLSLPHGSHFQSGHSGLMLLLLLLYQVRTSPCFLKALKVKQELYKKDFL